MAAVTDWAVLNNGITPYLWAHVHLSPAGLAVRMRRTVLGVVPTGVVDRQWPVDELHDVRVAAWLHVDRFLVLVACVLLLVLAEPTGIARIVLIVVAVLYVPLSIVAVLRIEPRTGPVTRVPLCLLHIPRGRRISAAVAARR